MPELPDLYVFAKKLKAVLCGKTIVSAEIWNPFQCNENADAVKVALLGSRFVDIVREGKELWFRLDNNAVFAVHLMLNGRFDICRPTELAGKRDKILSVGFENGQTLLISDYKSLCRVTFHPTVTNTPDALGKTFTTDYLRYAAKQNARKNIKAFLIDQHIIKGIGNAYADEILWVAGISPKSVTGKIPEEMLSALYSAVRNTLQNAIDTIERLSPDRINGEERRFLQVHNPSKTHTDAGDEILVQKIAGKITYYTNNQQLFK